MADFAPPTGPPPPKVPEGWKAVWNDQYKEWFFVNIYTKKSQWDKPTEPIYPPGEEAPAGPPPSYGAGETKLVAAEKTGLSSNNPYGPGPGGASSSHNLTEDEKLARQLQEEENARAHGGRPTSRGASDSYYQSGTPQPGTYGQQPGGYDQYGGQQGYGQQTYGQQGYGASPGPESEKGKSKGGFLGKLLGKSSSSHQQQQYPPQQQYGGYPQQGGYGSPAPHGGYPPQQGYYGGGYPQQQYAQRPPKKGGLGAGGAAALGVGGGLLGGMMLGEMAADAGDGGGDYGGDDGGFGGDDGGGDFGGDF